MASGCATAGSTPSAEPSNPEPAVDPPERSPLRLAGRELPPLPAAEPALAETTRAALDAAERCLAREAVPAPPQPIPRTMRKYDAWGRSWLRRLSLPIEHLADRAEDLRAREQPVAFALIALCFEQLGRLAVAAWPRDAYPPDAGHGSNPLHAVAQHFEELASSAHTDCLSAPLWSDSAPWRRLCERKLAGTPSPPRWTSTRPPGPPPEGPARCWIDAAPLPAPETSSQRTAGPNRLVFLMPGPGSLRDGAPLLAQERERLHRAVIEEFGQFNDTLSWRRTRELERAWLQGRSGPDGGPTCRRSPSLVQTARDALPGAVVVPIATHCDGQVCWLELAIPRFEPAALSGAPETSVRLTEIAHPMRIEAWTRSVDHMAVASSLHEWLGPRGRVVAFGEWRDPSEPEAVLSEHHDALRDCAASAPHPQRAFGFVLEVATDGRVADIWIRRSPNGADARACMRRVLRGLRFSGDARGPRRLRIRTELPTDTSPRRRFGRLDADTGVRVSTRRGRHSPGPMDAGELMGHPGVRAALATCHERAFGEATTTAALRAQWTLASSGRTLELTMAPLPTWTSPPDGYRECVREVLAGLGWPCPRTSETSALLTGTVCTFRE